MDPQEFLLVVFCTIDDQMKALGLGKLRRRGFDPKLSDAEVITIEIVGEFLGLDRDTELYRHFRAYHTAEFPALARVSRSGFARQAANLWRLKQLIQHHQAERLAVDQPLWLADSLPIEARRFGRATSCRRFAGVADYGYDLGARRTFYGFRLHLRVSREGIIQAYELAPARAADRAMLEALKPPPETVGIGDRGYWSPELPARLEASGVRLLVPYPHRSKDPDPRRSARLASVRYRIETVNGQLAERYRIKRTWARDLWHLCHRLIRKLLSHTVMVWIAVSQGLPPLSFDRLRPTA